MKDLELQDAEGLFGLVRMEAARQIGKWGIQDCHPFEWLAYLAEEFGEVSKAVNEAVYREGAASEVVTECIQVATLALKMAEMYRAAGDPARIIGLEAKNDEAN